ASGKVQAFVWRYGVMSNLGLLPGGDSSEAHAINDGGVIVGRANGANNVFRAVLWNGGAPTDLGTGIASNRAAHALNICGALVGEAPQLVPPFFSFLQTRAVQWSA